MLDKLRQVPRSALRLFRRPFELQSKPSMRVNVLVAPETAPDQHQLLLFPEGTPSEVPDHLGDLTWRHLATTTLRERLLAPAAPVIEAQIGSQGYALLTLAK